MFPQHLKTKSGDSYLIREATAADASALIKYINKVAGETDFLSVGIGDFKKTIEEEKNILETFNKTKNKIFLIAEIKGKITGALTLDASSKPRLKHVGDIGISVKKDFWGQGIGSSLISALLEWAEVLKIIHKINLRVQTNNKTAISLYKKFGFKQEGIIRRELFVDGNFYDAYAMGKLIN